MKMFARRAREPRSDPKSALSKIYCRDDLNEVFRSSGNLFFIAPPYCSNPPLHLPPFSPNPKIPIPTPCFTAYHCPLGYS